MPRGNPARDMCVAAIIPKAWRITKKEGRGGGERNRILRNPAWSREERGVMGKWVSGRLLKEFELKMKIPSCGYSG
jgi:hypothetical protein